MDRVQNLGMATDLMYLRDAYMTEFDASVVDVRENAVALDRTAFYPTGGGQPNDTGTLAGRQVVDVRKDGDLVWHSFGVEVPGELPAVGSTVHGVVDWD